MTHERQRSTSRENYFCASTSSQLQAIFSNSFICPQQCYCSTHCCKILRIEIHRWKFIKDSKPETLGLTPALSTQRSRTVLIDFSNTLIRFLFSAFTQVLSTLKIEAILFATISLLAWIKAHRLRVYSFTLKNVK